jgi:peptide/bleomycin uptake transporter
MLLWFTLGPTLQAYLNIGALIGTVPSETNPEPFFTPETIWLYQFVLVVGYLFCIPWYWIGGNRRWYWWSVVGSVTIIEIVYFSVQVSAFVNSWYGEFYDLMQTAITNPNTVPLDQFLGEIWTVLYVVVPNITIQVFNLFLVSHYLFRWRRAMTFYYMTHWQHLRRVEGASQRVQEDTQQFSRIAEGLAVSLVSSVMTLLVFLPLLWGLSEQVRELPWFGPVSGGLVWVALVSAAGGTALLALVGIRLPGLEFQNQRVEAAFRKELVYGEDHGDRARPPTVRELFRNVQRNYFRLYWNYLYFNVARYAYLQGSNFIPLIALGPSVVAGAITFGLVQQVLNAFDRVEESFKFLANSWTTIIVLISVYQRLRAFEAHIPEEAISAVDYDDPVYLRSEAEFDPPGAEQSV